MLRIFNEPILKLMNYLLDLHLNSTNIPALIRNARSGTQEEDFWVFSALSVLKDLKFLLKRFKFLGEVFCNGYLFFVIFIVVTYNVCTIKKQSISL